MHLRRAIGWGPVVPGVCTVHRLVLTPTVTTFEHHAALCPPIKFLCIRASRRSLRARPSCRPDRGARVGSGRARACRRRQDARDGRRACRARDRAGVKTAVTDRAGAARDGFVGAAQATSERVGSATTNVRTAVANRAGAATAWGLLPLSSSALARHDVAAAAAAARGATRRRLRWRRARRLRDGNAERDTEHDAERDARKERAPSSPPRSTLRVLRRLATRTCPHATRRTGQHRSRSRRMSWRRAPLHCAYSSRAFTSAIVVALITVIAVTASRPRHVHAADVRYADRLCKRTLRHPPPGGRVRVSEL